MSQKATTKDELFLLKLHEMASQLGSPKEEIDIYAIGRAIGQNDRGTETISRLLAQANFITKGEGTTIALTDHGLSLVNRLTKELK